MYKQAGKERNLREMGTDSEKHFSRIPKAELTDPQVEDLCHGELVTPPGEFATSSL